MPCCNKPCYNEVPLHIWARRRLIRKAVTENDISKRLDTLVSYRQHFKWYWSDQSWKIIDRGRPNVAISLFFYILYKGLFTRDTRNRYLSSLDREGKSNGPKEILRSPGRWHKSQLVMRWKKKYQSQGENEDLFRSWQVALLCYRCYIMHRFWRVWIIYIPFKLYQGLDGRNTSYGTICLGGHIISSAVIGP